MGLVVLLTMLCSQVIADEKTFSSPGIGYIEIRSEIEGAVFILIPYIWGMYPEDH